MEEGNEGNFNLNLKQRRAGLGWQSHRPADTPEIPGVRSNVTDTNTPYKHVDSIRTALKTMERLLLKNAPKPDSCAAKAVSRIQGIDAMQVILDSINERLMMPEESYLLRANYRVRKHKVAPNELH